MRLQLLNSIVGNSDKSSHHLFDSFCFGMMILLLSSCASPTETKVSFEAEMPLAPGEKVVLFPNDRRDASTASRGFVRCLRSNLEEKAISFSKVMDTAEFQDALFPWFEFTHAPQTVDEIDGLLSKPKVREQIAALNVRYLVSMTLDGYRDGFPGMFCGGGAVGAGCLGIAWEGKVSQLDAVVWDLKTGKEEGDLSVSSSGTSLALGVIFPIVFIAYTEEEACEALADKLGEILDGKTK